LPFRINSYRIILFAYPRDRIVGDSQVRSDHIYIGFLELISEAGMVGTGFFFQLFHPLPSYTQMCALIDREIAPLFLNKYPAVLLNRIARPRGGNRVSLPYNIDQALDLALWDLHAQEMNLPLYQLLGGTRDRIRVYASGLEFHLSDAETAAFYESAVANGFTTFKLKVGHPNLAWDLNRLKLITNIVGRNALLMVDANEAWSPKEAIRRITAYLNAGYNIYWVEDPCLREDFPGLSAISAALPTVHVNAGEYLSLQGKKQLIEARAVDILNIHAHISDGMKIGWLASEAGIPISLGNTPLEVGVHLACALPEVGWMEYSFQNYNHLVENPVRIEDGFAYPPQQPGHGLRLSEAARQEFGICE
jgi:L-alanine-DL-glutamate epimerase-like enolase superfamily enzyme